MVTLLPRNTSQDFFRDFSRYLQHDNPLGSVFLPEFCRDSWNNPSWDSFREFSHDFYMNYSRDFSWIPPAIFPRDFQESLRDYFQYSFRDFTWDSSKESGSPSGMAPTVPLMVIMQFHPGIDSSRGDFINDSNRNSCLDFLRHTFRDFFEDFFRSIFKHFLLDFLKDSPRDPLRDFLGFIFATPYRFSRVSLGIFPAFFP